MVGDYISTSYGSDNLAHSVFATANVRTPGSACTTSARDNCHEAMTTFAAGAATGSVAAMADPVLFSGKGGADAASLWNVVDNNGSKYRD